MTITFTNFDKEEVELTWHQQPGGNYLVYITHKGNTPTFSAGYSNASQMDIYIYGMILVMRFHGYSCDRIFYGVEANYLSG